MNAKSVQQPVAQIKPVKQRHRNTQQEDAWYKRYPRDFHDGTRELTLEERGAYSDIVDLIFILGRPIPDNSKSIAHSLHVSARTWNRIRNVLVAAGKLYVTEEGCLSNRRAEEELDDRKQARQVRGERLTNSGSTADERPNKPCSTQTEQELLKKNVFDINDRLRVQAPYARASLESDTDTEEERRESLPVSVENRPRERTIENGLDWTEAVKTIAKWISPFAPDYDFATKNLQVLMKSYGEDVVLRAFTAMKIESNKGVKFRDPMYIFNNRCSSYRRAESNFRQSAQVNYKTARERKDEAVLAYQQTLVKG